jgi:HEAT repeat protein
MRPSVVVVSLGMIAACGGLVYMQSARHSPESAVETTPAASRATQSQQTQAAPGTARATAPETTATAATETASASSAAAEGTKPQAARPDTVEQWIKDTEDSDAKIRAAAIAKLANAPKAQALPALKNVLDTGEPDVDRHIALRSLHALALRDGDGNGQVRDVMRRAIYHSDNDGVTQTAQSLLDDVEAALAEQQQTPK